MSPLHVVLKADSTRAKAALDKLAGRLALLARAFQVYNRHPHRRELPHVSRMHAAYHQRHRRGRRYP